MTNLATPLTQDVRALIALGAAVAVNCEPCFKFHYDKASQLGVSADAVREAIAVGQGVKEGAAKKILGAVDRIMGGTESKEAAAACCGGSATASNDKAKSTCC
jgi:AhpD family alkylhydroperoxidase